MGGTIDTFSPTIKEMVRRAQHGYCKLCLEKIQDFHHKVSNSKTNQKLFPMFLQSIFNCVGLSRDCHDNRKNDPAIQVTHDEALAYEDYLRELCGREEKP